MSEGTTHPESNVTATWTAILGSALVVISLVAIVSANWDDFTSWLKMAVVVAPMLILYWFGLRARSKPVTRSIGNIALITGNLAFPFALGVVSNSVFQYPVDDRFLCILFGITAVWYLLQEILAHFEENVFLIISAVLAWLICMSNLLAQDILAMSLTVVVAIATVLWAGLRPVAENQERLMGRNLYMIFAVFLMVSASFSFPNSFAYSFSGPVDYFSGNSWYQQIGSLMIALVSFVLAITCGSFLENSVKPVFYKGRRAFELLFSINLLIPTTFLALVISNHASDLSKVLITATITAIIGFLISRQAAIKGIRILSTIAIVLVLIRLLTLAFDTLSISWPLVILLVGILLFAIAFIIASGHLTILNKLFYRKADQGWLGLGTAAPTEFQNNPKSDLTSNPFMLGLIVIAGLSAFWLIASLLTWITIGGMD